MCPPRVMSSSRVFLQFSRSVVTVEVGSVRIDGRLGRMLIGLVVPAPEV